VIHILRMRYNAKSAYKLMTRVRLDKYLDLSEYTPPRAGIENNKPLRYQLYDIVSHRGDDLEGGHYVATVRCQNGVDFVRVDDTKVSEFPTRKQDPLFSVDTSATQSYLVVYQKVGGEMAKCI
jgi:ubiquitin C-terminal hydrolase